MDSLSTISFKDTNVLGSMVRSMLMLMLPRLIGSSIPAWTVNVASVLLQFPAEMCVFWANGIHRRTDWRMFGCWLQGVASFIATVQVCSTLCTIRCPCRVACALSPDSCTNSTVNSVNEPSSEQFCAGVSAAWNVRTSSSLQSSSAFRVVQLIPSSHQESRLRTPALRVSRPIMEVRGKVVGASKDCVARTVAVARLMFG